MRYLFLTVLLASGFAVQAADIILPSGLTVLPGDQLRFRLMLAQPAPSGGVYLTLSSSNPSTFTVAPGAILISETQTTSPVDVVITGQNIGVGTVTVSAYGLADASAPVQVGAAPSSGFSPPNITITGAGATQNIILNLAGPAPAGGLNVALSSTNPGVATVPPSITFPANVSSLNVPITSVGPGSTVIHANAAPTLPDTTATVTVVTTGGPGPTAGTIGLPANVNVPTGASVPFPITLGSPAPAGGVLVTLASSDPARISVSPATVAIAAGATTPAAQPQLTAFNIGTVTIYASAPGYAGAAQSVQGTATVTFSPTAVTIATGSSARVLLSLSSAAPPGTSVAGRCESGDPSTCSITVTLSSDNPSVAQVQPTVSYFPDGSSQAINQIPIIAGGPGTTVIHAGAPPYIPDTTLTVTVGGGAGAPGTIILPVIPTLAPGQSLAFPISLSTPAPAGGVNVALTSSAGGNISIGPASVPIPAGATAPTTQPQITGLAAGSSTIGASAPGYTSASELVQVGVSLGFSPTSATIAGTGTATLQLYLSAPAPASGLMVTLTSNNTGAVTVPATVSFAPNATSVNVTATGIAPGSATITATAAAVSGASANVTVNSARDIILPSGISIPVGEQQRISVTLTRPAPAGGVFVSLTSSDPSILGIVPASAFIYFREGFTTTAAQPQLMGVATGSATLSAAAAGLTGDSQVVLVGSAASLLPGSLTITGTGVTQNLTLTLSSPAPANGLTFTLSSSNPGVASVPLTVLVPANATSASVPVTSLAPGSTVIHAGSPPAFGDTTASVTVVSGATIGLPSSAIVPLGQSVAFPITLGTPAPAGGVTVTLSSGDPSKVTVSPTSVPILAGATTPAIQPQLTGVNIGSAPIAASATGYTSASQSVQVNASLSFTPSSLSLNAGATQNLTLNFSAAAPSAMIVSLVSSAPGVATVPGSVTLNAGATSANVPVSGVASGSTTITANANSPNITNASASVSVGVVSGPGTIGLPANVKIAPNQPAPFPVTLSVPAPAGGVTVTLVSSDPTVVTVSASVFVAAGAMVPVTPAQINGLAYGTANITATAPGYTSASQPVQVGASISFAAATAAIGLGTSNLQLNLSSPAPATGLTVTLLSSNTGAVTVPATVSFAPNTASVNVPVTGIAPGSATVTASAAPVGSASTSVTVNSAKDIILPTGLTVPVGEQLRISVTLSRPAPAGGVFVTLSSSDTSKLDIVSATASIYFREGTTTTSAQPQLIGVASGVANLSANAPGLTGDTQVVLVGSAASLQPASLTITGTGVTQNLTLTLSAPAAGNLLFNLSSSDPTLATVPGTVIVPANATTASVPVTSVTPGTVVIHASSLPTFGDTTATVSVASAGTILLPAGVNLPVGQTMTFALTLGTPAPAGGLTVALNSGDSTKLAVSPNSVPIAAGATTPAIQPQITGVNGGVVSVTASAPGFRPAIQAVQVTAGLSFAPTSLNITAPATQNLTLSLAAPAQAALTVSLVSSNPAAATVPASVMFAVGAISMSVPVTGVAQGSATITASAPNVSNATASISVAPPIPPGTITLPANVTLAPGQAAPFPVTLSTPAPAGGVTVTLVSNDPSVTVSPSVSVAAGAVAPVTQAQITGVSFGTATITASAPGYTQTSQPVQVGATLSFTPSNLTMPGVGAGNLQLNLSAAAPAGGLTVNMTSNNTSAVTVPSSVSFTAGATSVNVPVTGAAPGSATITASAAPTPNVPNAIASVVVSAPEIILPSGLTLASGDQLQIQVTLTKAVPAGGVVVTFASSDTTKLTVAPLSVSLNAGTASPIQLTLTGTGAGSATLSASAPGFVGNSKTVTVGPPAIQAPTANAGSGQTVAIGATVQLNGSGTDPQNLPLTYQWSLAKPAGSAAALSNPGIANPTFVADKFGNYVAQLIVSNGTLSSQSSFVTIATQRPKPIANAGASQNAAAGSTVTLNGNASSSIDNHALTYAWTFSNRPNTSTAVLTGPATATPSFVPDIAGAYVVQLIVNDGTLSSDPATVTITVGPGAPASITASGGTPQSTALNQASCTPLVATVKDSKGNLVSGATVTFQAPSSGPGGTFTGGSITATAITDASGVATAPAFTVNGTAGSYNVTASVAGVATPASFAITNFAVLATSIVPSSGSGQSTVINSPFSGALIATVTAGPGCGSSPGGLTVTFTAPGSGAGGTFVGGGTVATALTNPLGVATSPLFIANQTVGSYSVNASVPGVATPASFALTNSQPVGTGGITVGNVSVGQNLQASAIIQLVQTAPAGTQLTVTSSDPSLLLVSARQSGTGSASVLLGVGANQSLLFYVQGLASSGTAYVTVSADGVGSGVGKMTLSPSGFILSGPNGPGAPFTLGNGAKATLTVTAGRLDSSFNFLEAQELRVGASADVFVTSTNTGIGTITTSPVTFTGAQGATATTQFMAAGVGSTTILAAVPPGYNTPSAGANMLTATVNTAGLVAGNVTVGRDLQASTRITLIGAAPSFGLTVLVTSNDPSKVLLSTAPDVAGSAQIMLPVQGGGDHTPDFYVQGLAGSGNVTYTATAPGFISSTGTATLTASGIILLGAQFGITTSPGAPPTQITVSSAQSDPNTGTAVPAPVRGGISVSVNVTSSNQLVGTITTSPVTIAGGSSSATTNFKPGSPGTTTVSVNLPAGSLIGQNSVNVTVTSAGIGVTSASVGMNLQTQGTLTLSQAPPADLNVKLTSKDPNLLLSNSANTPGSSSIFVVVPANSTTANYYLQAFASSGTPATYDATASGYQSGTGTVTFGNSGVVLSGPFGIGSTFFPAPLSGGPVPMAVYTALLDSNGYHTQQLAPGFTVTASLSSSSPNVGTVTPQVTIVGGSDNAAAQFIPLAAGSSTVTVSTPAGYTTGPFADTRLIASVN